MASLDNEKTEIINEKVRPPGDANIMSKGRIIKNLLMVNFGYLLLYAPWMGLTNLQSTLNSEGSVGVISQSIVYLSFLSTALFLPRLISIKFGLKNAIAIAHLAFLPYIAGNFNPTLWFLAPAAAITGIGTGTIWISISAYINGLSYLYAGEDKDKAKPITVKFFGIFYLVFNACQIFGNLISFVVFQPKALNSTMGNALVTEKASLSISDDISHVVFKPINFTAVHAISKSTAVEISDKIPNVSCGANFCGKIDEKIELPSYETRYLLIGIYLGLSVLSVLVTSFFVDSLKVSKKEKEKVESACSKLISSLKQVVKIDQMLLIGITIYCAFQAGFMFCDFTEAFVGCAWGLEYVGLVSMIFAAASGVMCLVQSSLSHYMPRIILIAVAMFINMGICVVLFNWEPSSDHYFLMYLIPGFWGLADGIWNTQLTAFYGVVFREEEEAAFANYRLWESLGLMLSFGCNSLICTSSKIYMQIIVASVGYIGYLIVELRAFLRKKSFTVTKIPEKHEKF